MQEEQKTVDSCKEYFSDTALLNAFILTYDRMRRYQGAWHLEKEPLFPANVLLETENEDILRDELKQRKGVSSQGQVIQRMDLEEEKFLRFLCGRTGHLAMSRGVIRNGVMQVTEGPLKGIEEQICKIDRHKRLARIQTTGQNIRYIPAGLEIIEKSI